jgi:VanZ family protein
MIVKTALGSNAFWLWAMIPVFLLVFEGWTYFIPMLVYRGTSLLPALVDVVGAFSATALFVRMRSRARELSIIV